MFNIISNSGMSLADRDSKWRTPRDVAEDSGLDKNVFEIDQWVLHLTKLGNSNFGIFYHY